MSVRDSLMNMFAYGGFSIYHWEEERFIIRPTGREDIAEALLEWQGDRPVVIATEGTFRGKKKIEMLQSQIDAWVAQAQAEG